MILNNIGFMIYHSKSYNKCFGCSGYAESGGAIYGHVHPEPRHGRCLLHEADGRRRQGNRRHRRRLF